MALPIDLRFAREITWGSLFRGGKVWCLVSCITRSKGGRYKPGYADLLKTISIGFIADGLIFKGLIGPFRLVT